MKKDILILVAKDFEDMELITPCDIFSRNKISYDLASIDDKSIVKGKYNAIIKTKKLKNINKGDYRSLFLPGGPGVKYLLKNTQVIQLTQYFGMNKSLFAICAAPAVMIQAGISPKEFTAFPGSVEKKGNSKKEVVVYKNVITGRDYLVSDKFAFAIIEYLKSN